jgi:hypothetical protein
MELRTLRAQAAASPSSRWSRAPRQGGVEAYIEALRIKSAMPATLEEELDLKRLKILCAHMATVRRRMGPYLAPESFHDLRKRIELLVSRCEDTSTADARIAGFCAGFPDDREHRWVRDLAAELLHYGDPERYPLMSRWVWDARTNTGVLREIWHAENVDQIRIEIADGYATFLKLREELAQYLAANGVYRDVLFYVDILCADLRRESASAAAPTCARISTPEDSCRTRRILGLDGVDAAGRTRLKAVEGRAEVIE